MLAGVGIRDRAGECPDYRRAGGAVVVSASKSKAGRPVAWGHG
ncbi:hypothetical protein [Nocardia abscessus]|nr:hypothetical protein [Nocardia abscessus]